MASNANLIIGLLAVALLASAMGTMTAVTKLSATGLQTGQANATVTTTTDITLPVSSINFGSMAVAASDDTTDNDPKPFEVQNDGSVNINVTVNSTALWSTQNTSISYYKFKCAAGEVACATGSVTEWEPMPVYAAATLVIANLPFLDSGDTNKVHIGITVPYKEPAGAKSATVTFTASQA